MLNFMISLVALAGVCMWHAVVLLSYKDKLRPDTISEHALRTAKQLGRHRVFHVLFSVSLISYALLQLIPERQYLLATLLIVGSAMDVVEVFTLKESDPTHPISATPHQISAWVMAFAYLNYGVLIVKYSGLPAWIYNGVWILFILNLSLAAIYKFKKFWISQMFYFTVLAAIIAYAHYRLI
jgi:hypothetical protein